MFTSRKKRPAGNTFRSYGRTFFEHPTAGPRRAARCCLCPSHMLYPAAVFREIYYWDSYFTAQGLNADGHPEMVLAMAENFRHLIQTIGHIPNGNRAYYLSRSQPPFFTAMADFVVTIHGSEKIMSYLPAVEKEYTFWMDETGEKGRRTVSLDMPSGNSITLNRYWDDFPAPREESWYEDMELAEAVHPSDREQLFRNIRAACESGWDFSSRWLADGNSLSTIQTTRILPIDLNTLMWYMEEKLADWHRVSGNAEKGEQYARKAAFRELAIQELMWSDEDGFFFDYHIDDEEQTHSWSLAAVYPLYFGLANKDQAKSVSVHLEKKFLRDGGLITTTVDTGQQWDSPNGLGAASVDGVQRFAALWV